MIVRPATPADVEACQKIVTGLPDFFTDDVPRKIEEDLATQASWVVVAQDDDVVGFAVVDVRPPGAAEIVWMAVSAELRNRGIGTMLLERVLDDLRSDGVGVVEVKTLAASAGYEPYIATRAFWEGNGFVQIDTIDPLPGWEPGNPSAIYVCALATTR